MKEHILAVGMMIYPLPHVTSITDDGNHGNKNNGNNNPPLVSPDDDTLLFSSCSPPFFSSPASREEEDATVIPWSTLAVYQLHQRTSESANPYEEKKTE